VNSEADCISIAESSTNRRLQVIVFTSLLLHVFVSFIQCIYNSGMCQFLNLNCKFWSKLLYTLLLAEGYLQWRQHEATKQRARGRKGDEGPANVFKGDRIPHFQETSRLWVESSA
ncbi:hypothetical protein KI387_001032, partial [Taxus chinensis]